MDSFASSRNTGSRVVPKEFEFSSSSSSSSSSVVMPEEYYSPPSSPPSTPPRFVGIPFSWEKTPGIPKKLDNGEEGSTDDFQGAGRSLLPPPPLATTPSFRRFPGPDGIVQRKKALFSPGDAGVQYQQDPFVAALVECSKKQVYGDGGKRDMDHEDGPPSSWIGRGVSRSLSDRFGLIALYGSCKKASPTSASIVYIPRSSRSSSLVSQGN